MGEYATRISDRQEIKIGTCEDMYYLRYDQRNKVSGGDATGWAARNWDGARFRFPFPSEDTIAPGAFEDYDKGLNISGWEIPSDWPVDHGTVQFTADQGYVVSLPCPEVNPDETFGESRYGTLKVHRNGFKGSLFIVQQRLIKDDAGCTHLVPILRCACGSIFNIGTDYVTFESLAVFLRSMADEDVRRESIYNRDITETHFSRMLHTVADRILSGYNVSDPS
ncbi:hypothetical protein F5X71_34680 [Nocardia brasiliensis]|uniref:Uncharacterized protein n=1 Tax=Nocardia brasiliensis TaxID=37326 RepID=A0A6G9Y133_NOCBR|nr:hypothetical protein [Nocardia brasiliensis]QIS06773.1 hypothetical protein F5X71_34680 [Nocardia brasiliensis]